MKLSTVIKILVGILFTVLGLYFFFKDVDIDKLLAELASVRISAIVICCAMAVLTLYLRAVRWGLILPPLPDTSKDYLFRNVTIGFMINNLLPFRIGELARILILWQKNRFPVAVCAGSIILERAIDLMMFLVFFCVPVFFIPRCAFLMPFALLAGGAVLGAILAMILYVNFQSFTVKVGTWFVSFFPEKLRDRLKKLGKELTSTLDWLYSPTRIVQVVALSFCTSFCYVILVIILAGKTEITFGILEGMFMQAFAAFGTALPGTPGYVGTQHFAIRHGLEILGMSTEKSQALAIIYHALNYVVINVIGLIFFFSMKLSFREIFSAGKKLNDPKMDQ